MLLLEGLEMEAFYGYGRPTERAGEGSAIMFNVNWNSLLFSGAALSGGSQFSSRPRRERVLPRGTSSFT